MLREGWNREASSGLEAAIVFIAIIVIASIFAYVVLGAGIFASQKSQEVMHAGLMDAGSALRLGDVVIVKMDSSRDLVERIVFDLETMTDLAAFDMGSMTYTIATKEKIVTLPPGDVTLTWRYPKDGGPVLEAGEVVMVELRKLESVGIGPGDTFTLGITAAEGATASLTRTVPSGIGKNAYVELF